MRMSLTDPILPCVIAIAGIASSADWPQWRGPDRSGVSVETGWGVVAQSEPLWRKELGNGHSSFSIADGRVYTLGYDVEAGQDVVFCFDAQNGEEIWRHAYEAAIWDTAHDGGTLTTPTIDGDLVYTTNREGKVFCLDRLTGEVKWSRDAMKDHDVTPHTWGFSASPLVIDGMVIVNYGNVHAFDKDTGEDVWNTETNFGFAYSTPAAFEHDGRSLLAVFCGNGAAVVDRSNGEELAFYEWIKNPQIYPMTPVVIGEDRIFISAGYDRGACMLQLAMGDDGYTLTPLWENRVMRNKMSGAVLYEDHLYGFDESILKCIDLDGNEMWRKRGFGTGAMSVVGGRLVIITGRGQVVIAEATPEEYRELSSQEVLTAGTYWSTPVLSHGLLYCRNSLGNMACLDFRTDDIAAANIMQELPDTLPTAQHLVASHLEIIGGADRLRALKSVQMSGTRESLFNTVSTGDVTLLWQEGVGYEWSGGEDVEVGYRGEDGWSVGDGAPRVLTAEERFAEREVGEFKRLLDFTAYYTDAVTAEVVVFDNRPCYRVESTTIGGAPRNLYFEVETGLYAGLDGQDVDMWALRDYRDAGDGLLLPTKWSLFDSATGEMETATFEEITVNGEIAADAIAPPQIIVLLNRSPEEKAKAEDALREKYGEMLIGEWKFSMRPRPEGAPPLVIGVEDGMLALVGGPEGPTYISEPDEHGRMMLIGSGGVSLVLVRSQGDPDVIEALSVQGGGDEFDRLVRAEQ